MHRLPLAPISDSVSGMSAGVTLTSSHMLNCFHHALGSEHQASPQGSPQASNASHPVSLAWQCAMPLLHYPDSGQQTTAHGRAERNSAGGHSTHLERSLRLMARCTMATAAMRASACGANPNSANRLHMHAGFQQGHLRQQQQQLQYMAGVSYNNILPAAMAVYNHGADSSPSSSSFYASSNNGSRNDIIVGERRTGGTATGRTSFEHF